MWDKESKKVKMENVLNTEIDHDIADEIFDEDDYDDQEWIIFNPKFLF